MGYGIDNCLGNSVSGQLVGHGRCRSFGAGSHASVDFGHNEIDRLVYKLKYCPPVDLIRRDGLTDLAAMEVETLHFG